MTAASLSKTATALVVGVVLLTAASPRSLRAQQQEEAPLPLQFWHVGDDALSQKLAKEIYVALSHESAFIPSVGKQPRSLLVELPANVSLKKVGKRTKVTYTVNYSNADNQRISSHDGSCPETQLSACAEQIVRGARIAARKVK